jgi:hypothetical protein
MIQKKTKDSFWEVVEDCLIEFHDFSKRNAQERSAKLREKIEHPPKGMSSDIFYHAEPFDVACDLAEKPLELSSYWAQYEELLNRHNK